MQIFLVLQALLVSNPGHAWIRDNRRCWRQTKCKLTSFSFGRLEAHASVASSNVIDESTPTLLEWNIGASKTVPLSPLSTNPLLFVSKTPILTQEQCRILIDHCKRQTAEGKGLLEQYGGYFGIFERRKHREALHTLETLQQKIHHEIMGQTIEDHVPAPRFLEYLGPVDDNACKETNEVDLKSRSTVTREELFPDGLHVDTNNCMHFRHWTVLVYLDDCKYGGATNFPLAIRQNQNTNEISTQTQLARNAASELLLTHDIHHTRLQDEHKDLGQVIEDAAVRCYYADGQRYHSGLRVQPQRGHACIFSGVQHDGYPNPHSFHGGEALFGAGESKHVLTFFYEVPLQDFETREDFGRCVQSREEEFLRRHGFKYS